MAPVAARAAAAAAVAAVATQRQKMDIFLEAVPAASKPGH